MHVSDSNANIKLTVHHKMCQVRGDIWNSNPLLYNKLITDLSIIAH
jgi:hypothetical protein